MSKRLTPEKTEFLRALTLQYGDALTKYAYRLCRYQPHLKQTAQDAVQETFVKAIQHVDDLMIHPNKIGWLKLSLRNTLYNLLRTQRWTGAPLAPPPEAPDAFDAPDAYPRLREVIAAAGTILDEGENATFQDHFLSGLTVAETAAREALPTPTVRSRIRRIRRKLKIFFEWTCFLMLLMGYIK